MNDVPGESPVLFDEIAWRDPRTGRPMELVVAARAPSGVPMFGALRVSGTDEGYPIVNGVARVTPELAQKHGDWLKGLGLKPAGASPGPAESFQTVDTVDSFGFQWSFNREMRSPEDLAWRVADRFRLGPEKFRGLRAVDAGAGAGDQSRWMIDRGASVVSVDLSHAIDVVAEKLRLHPRWVGIQGDVTNLPLADAGFDLVYCEGVLMATRDTDRAIAEFARVLRSGGLLLTSHYLIPRSLRGRLRLGFVEFVRRRVKVREPYEILWITGSFAALAYLPGLRWLVRRSGLANYSERMPAFRTTWTNTHDSYGGHAFQRFIKAEEFRALFDRVPGTWVIDHDGVDVIAARRAGDARAPDARP